MLFLKIQVELQVMTNCLLDLHKTFIVVEGRRILMSFYHKKILIHFYCKKYISLKLNHFNQITFFSKSGVLHNVLFYTPNYYLTFNLVKQNKNYVFKK